MGGLVGYTIGIPIGAGVRLPEGDVGNRYN